MKLLSLLTGICCIFGNWLSSVSNIVSLEYGAVFLKIVIFIFMSSTHCHHITQHVNVYTNMSSLCLIFSGLYQIFSLWSSWLWHLEVWEVDTNFLVKLCASIIRPDPECGIWYSEMLVHTHVIFTTGKAITWTLATLGIWELTRQNSFLFYIKNL